MVENPETPENSNASAAPGDEGGGKRKGLSFPAFLAVVVLVSLAFRSFAFSLYNIPSESMLPRLMNGDYLVASKWDYGFSRHSLPFDLPLGSARIFASLPARGDVVIFKHPIDGRDYIKRVIGLPGDHVEMRGGRLVLNGETVPQTPLPDLLLPLSANTGCAPGAVIEREDDGTAFCRYTRYRENLPGGVTHEVIDIGTFPRDDWGPRRVPEGTVFLLGDNRDNSQDSRFPPEANGGIGFVPMSFLVGKARLVVWSTDGSAEWLRPWTWVTAARGGRMWEGI